MRKTRLQHQQIVMAVDRSTGIVDLSVFALPCKGHRTQTVGTATLRMADVPEARYGCSPKDCGARTYSLRQRLPQKVEETKGGKILTSLSQIDDGSGRISECRQELEGKSDV